MTTFGLHDPNTSRHHILVLMALVARLGNPVEVSYDELQVVADAGWQIEVKHDQQAQVIRLTLMPAPRGEHDRIRGRRQLGEVSERPGLTDGSPPAV